MSTAIRVKPKRDKPRLGKPVKDAAGARENDREIDLIHNCKILHVQPAINDVMSIKRGIIKTSRHQVRAPYNILLVGETGTGKSSLLEFLANALNGKSCDRYDFEFLDHRNERGGSSGQSQTSSARVYEFTSKNGILVRILDTPGLADTRGIHQDKLHKKSIATQIGEHIASVNAVLILVNGTVPRITVGTNYALYALSALFPKTLVNNIAFLFSNTPTLLSLNISDDAIPSVLTGAPRFLLDNPIALKKKCLEIKDVWDNNEKGRKEMGRLVHSAERRALKTLVALFDWMDNLEPQPTTEIVTLYERSQAIEVKITNTLAQVRQASDKRAEIDELMRKYQRKSTDVDAFSNIETIITEPFWRQQPASTLNYLCTMPYCYSTCGVQHSLASVLLLLPVQLKSCSECAHPHLFHFHLRSEWVPTQEIQVSVEKDMKGGSETEKDENEMTVALTATSRRALSNLNRIVNDSMSELARSAAEYAHLSLSGCFSAPLERAISLLEQQCKGMEEMGVDPEQLEMVRRSLKEMKERLDLLREAQRRSSKGHIASAGGSSEDQMI